jgi:hypothetical protein
MAQTVSGTQCYIEVESWDSSSELAVLHIKVPYISSSSDTELYLAYSSSWTDNSEFVGDTGSTAAKAVWDNNFLGVWHMAQEPDGAGSMLDSTSNEYHGDASAGLDKVTNGVNFSSADDDYIYTQAGTHDFDETTVEAHVRADSYGGNNYGRLFRMETVGETSRVEFYLIGAPTYDIRFRVNNSSAYEAIYNDFTLDTDAEMYLVGTCLPYDNMYVLLDGEQVGSDGSPTSLSYRYRVDYRWC